MLSSRGVPCEQGPFISPRRNDMKGLCSQGSRGRASKRKHRPLKYRSHKLLKLKREQTEHFKNLKIYKKYTSTELVPIGDVSCVEIRYRFVCFLRAPYFFKQTLNWSNPEFWSHGKH